MAKVSTFIKLIADLREDSMINDSKIHRTGKDHFAFRSGSPLSNFYEQAYTVRGFTYHSGEHEFQLGKAMYFRDWDSFDAISKCKTPLEAKRLGRKVQNFDADLWSLHSLAIMRQVCANRVQLESVQVALALSLDLDIVEAAPRDTIWGTGYGLDRSAEGESRGYNKLGIIWTNTRTKIYGR